MGKKRKKKRITAIRRYGERLLEEGRAGAVRIAPSDEVKMSEVLTEFIEPWEAAADTDIKYRFLLGLAVVAWNLSLLPEEFQGDLLASSAATVAPNVPEVPEMISELVERKKAHFAEVRRLIAGYELSGSGVDRVLVVASTPLPF